MARIIFATKLKLIKDDAGNVVKRLAKVPKIKKNHCQMSEFRDSSHKLSAYANSDFFEGMLASELRKLNIKEYIDIGDLPEFVSIENGFLTTVTIDI